MSCPEGSATIYGSRAPFDDENVLLMKFIVIFNIKMLRLLLIVRWNVVRKQLNQEECEKRTHSNMATGSRFKSLAGTP